jgi:cyclohexadieny/prephenate dehydrogenase
MTEPPFPRLALIGTGLIGGSIARAARHYGGIATTIIANTRTQKSLDRVKELGFADICELDPAKAAEGADLVILCSPVGTYAQLAEQIAPALKPGAIISDVGSTKQSVIRDIGPFVPAGVHFVPSHPMAGTEFSGPDSGFAELFQNRWCILTPPPGTDDAATEKLESAWKIMGAITARMDAAHHDRVAAIVSHLPHLLAFTICGTADDLADETRQEVLQFAASGFRDFTRIAASDPTMWSDIFMNNKDAILEMLARFSEDAQAMARAIRWGDTSYIEDKINRSRRIRQSLIDLKQA